jgi:hypothetical protein
MKKYYYSVSVYSFNSETERSFDIQKVAGVHIIKAQSKKAVLEIRERHGISNPRFAKVVNLRIKCTKLDMRLKSNKELIKCRKQGIGGSVWYEDENGNLQKEI